MIRLSIDMETASINRNAAILTLGAHQFGLPYGTPAFEFYEKASLASNERRKFDISRETMEWWDKQDPVMRNEVFSGTQDIGQMLESFSNWCTQRFGNLNEIELWSRGADFDCVILQNAYMEIWGEYPFNFRNHMCQRTVSKIIPPHIMSGIPKQEMKHHALEDARYQGMVLDVAFNTMRWN